MATGKLWESCSKFYSEHFCLNTFCKNIVSLKVIIIIKFYIDIYEKSALEQFCHILLLIDHCIVQGFPKDGFYGFASGGYVERGA